MRAVELYDTTLRDGMQGEGLSLSAEEKLRVAQRLDELGVGFVEAGFPSSNPKEIELFDLLRKNPLSHSAVAAFGMTRRRGTEPGDDPSLRVVADSGAPVATIVGKTWSLHLEKVVKVDRSENLAMIEDSLAFLATGGQRVIYDAEHFFDGWADDRDYALECVRAAVRGGAETVVLCDTNGATLPTQVAEAVAAVCAEVAGQVKVGIHCHNDLECGVANSLAAVEAGAAHVQGTINGIGERCGNANLVSVAANLELKMGIRCLPAGHVTSLTRVSHFVDEICNRVPNPAQAYVGRSAFAHKGGMHVAGVMEDAKTFEHVDPEAVGNHRELLVGELSGKGTIQARAELMGLKLDDETAGRLVETVKEHEHAGYHYEAADASLELMIRKETGGFEPLFELESWRVIVEKLANGGVKTEATVKVLVNGERQVSTAEGNGPVNALDTALRAAVGQVHPELERIDLVNFKVRILNENRGTDAVTRVLLDATDGENVWGTTGVSPNVIEASWEALVDSLEYGMQPVLRGPGD
ncbi:MAG: citramalate synthase [Actinobacteria bacterium]|uniref:(R)-citramalate synthase n=1 Tax=freshwater metagenome TaxID=449393 RepID=A0A6J7E5D5_9ZZZZ|nr:citramalate synthase [Actinomycetota bacterium]